MTASHDSHSIFADVTRQLKEIYELPHQEKPQIKEALHQLEKVLYQLEMIHGRHSQEANILFVERAIIIGEVCLWVKNSLLHGDWTVWAQDNFSEGLRTLEKFMALAKSNLARDYAYLGTERGYQLTRLEHLLKEGAKPEDLFTDCALDTDLASYTGKKLERAVIMILNKAALTERGISLQNGALERLTENFSLIDNNSSVIGRLCEAKSEDADLEKVVGNMIATAGSRNAGKKRTKSKSADEDLNTVAEKFITSLQSAMENPGAKISKERLRFIAKLISEYMEAHNNSK